jgi:hypothetical protein
VVKAAHCSDGKQWKNEGKRDRLREVVRKMIASCLRWIGKSSAEVHEWNEERMSKRMIARKTQRDPFVVERC